MADDFMKPFDDASGKASKLSKIAQKVTKTSLDPHSKINARMLLKKVIQGLDWEAKQKALDIIRAEIEASPKIGAAGTMDVSKLPVDYTAKPESDVAPWTRKDARKAGGTTDDEDEGGAESEESLAEAASIARLKKLANI